MDLKVDMKLGKKLHRKFRTSLPHMSFGMQLEAFVAHHPTNVRQNGRSQNLTHSTNAVDLQSFWPSFQ